MLSGRKPLDKSILEGKSINHFREAIKSPSTLSSYERRLIEFLTGIGYNVDRFVKESRSKPKWAEDTIITYLLKHKERAQKGEISSSTLANIRLLNKKRYTKT